MENLSKSSFIKIILLLITAGIWVITLQNAGVIPTNQDVKVVNTVETHSEVSGSVSVDNIVDVNIQEINGYNTVTTGSGTHSVFPYGYMLPVDSF
jgi:uncharacterized membrane protein (Fun14 family)